LTIVNLRVEYFLHRESSGQIAMIETEARKEAASRTARLDAVFAALADPTRRAIIERLSRSEARVTEVAEPFRMSLNAVSKHIRVLEASGVVERHRKGRDHILSINTRSLDEVDGWIERMRRYWEKRLDAMEHLLRELKKDHKLGPKDRKHGSR
jgi:DNA-binding transcriptional ArsR family regulator